MTGGLLNITGLCAALGIGRTAYYRRKARGEFRRFEVAQPVGQKRFSADLVARYVQGEPVGAKPRAMRRAS